MTHTHKPAALAGRRSPEPRALPVFADGGPIVATDDIAANPELMPDADALGRMVGNLVTDPGDGDGTPTHAPLSVTLDAEVEPLGVYKATDGRLYAHGMIVTLGGAKVNLAGVSVYFELNPAAPVGAVASLLFRPARPATNGEG